ncbi:MAG: hypothetical protein CMH58_08310 [Myxococcales bacterium]|nr:hypothetical protein [Myxococcales bacterium]
MYKAAGCAACPHAFITQFSLKVIVGIVASPYNGWHKQVIERLQPMTTHPLVDRFQVLGQAMTDALGTTGSDASPRFSRIAAEQLECFLPKLRGFSLEDILSAALTTKAEQLDVESHFGDPPITWFMGERFCIESYVWNDNSTSVHDHAFAGAWTTLVGQSLHRQYRFEADKKITPDFELGRLFLQKGERLVPGMVRQITPSDQFIHDLYHLDRPSITLIIRTCRLDHPLRGQRHYIGHEQHALALKTFDRPPMETLQRRLLKASLQDDEANFRQLFKALLEQEGFERITRLTARTGFLLSHKQLGDCLRLLENRWPHQGHYVSEALLHQRQLATMINLRHRRTDTQDRLLLGLLRCPSTREDLLEQVRTLAETEDPAAWIFQRFEQWAEEGELLQLTPTQREALRGILEGQPARNDEILDRFTLQNEPLLQVLGKP